MSQFVVVRLQCVTWGGGDGKPSKRILEWQPIGTGPIQWFPIPLTHHAGAALFSIFKHTQTPKGGEIVPDPLISSPASKMGDCLMKMDHSDGFTFHI